VFGFVGPEFELVTSFLMVSFLPLRSVSVLRVFFPGLLPPQSEEGKRSF